MHKRKNEEEMASRSLEDKAFDLFGEMLLARETDAMLSEIAAEEATGNDAEYEAFISRSRKRNLKAIDAYVRKQKLRKYIRPLRIAGQVAAVAVLTLSLAVAAVANNQTVRIQMMQLLATHQEEYTDLRMQEDEEASFDVPAEWKGKNYPSFLPDNLEVTDSVALFDSNHIEYTDPQNPERTLSFMELGPDTAANVDTENAVLKPFIINGHSAMLFTKGNRIGVYWDNGQYYFLIFATDMDEATVQRVAESVIRVN